MKRKVKRFQEGGLEAEQKKRGLAASEGDKVGFFERIRMGNIDDPRSEAYKRFGAGRGQSVSQLTDIPYTDTDDFKNLNKAALREKSEVTDERDAREAAVSGPLRQAPPKTAKAPIVTKEQLEKSGLSLRDYMNKQKGLTRRGVKEEGPDTATLDRGAAEVRRIKAAEAAEAEQARIAKTRANEVPTVANRATDKKSPSERTGSQIMAKKQEDAEKVMNAARRAQVDRDPRDTDTVPSRPSRAFSTPASREAWDKKYGENYTSSGRKKTEVAGMKKGGTVKKYKEGGTVSSASKRADGIALRGKTRGRMM